MPDHYGGPIWDSVTGMHRPPLSARGRALADSDAKAAYALEHARREGQDGYIGLCVAENHLVHDLLRPVLEAPLDVPLDVVTYNDMVGRPDLRGLVAELLGQRLFHREVDPADVHLLAGAGAVLEALGTALGDPGDVVLVPTPSYPFFWADLGVRAGLRLQPVPTAAEEAFTMTTQALDRAAAQAPGPVRAVLLTNPDNPRGQLRHDVEVVLAWAAEHGVHVVADEVYALSTFGPDPMSSVGSLGARLGPGVHVVWGFSKDFAMSGIRCGVLVSEHPDLKAAMALQAEWGAVSGHTQQVLARMLADREFVEHYLTEMPRRLAVSARSAGEALRDAGIPHHTPDAGFFILCDLRAHLPEDSWAGEEALWRRLLTESGVNLTPGAAMRAPRPGLFRLCHAAQPDGDVVAEAIARVGAVVAAR